jgi:hypothetical protein
MCGAICLYRPAGQQQAQDNTENQLFLFRQAFHAVNVTENRRSSNNVLMLAVF